MFTNFIGKLVLVRSGQSGVHYGTLASVEGDTVRLTGARRLWYWKAAKSISLSGVCNFGINQSASRIAPEVSEHIVLGACEILPLTDEAAASIKEAPIAEAR